MERGVHITSLISLRMTVGQPSGPDDLSIFRDLNILHTICSVKTTSAMVGGGFSREKEGIVNVGSSEIKH